MAFVITCIIMQCLNELYKLYGIVLMTVYALGG